MPSGECTLCPHPGDEDPSDPLTGRRSRIDVVIDEAGRAGMHDVPRSARDRTRGHAAGCAGDP